MIRYFVSRAVGYPEPEEFAVVGAKEEESGADEARARTLNFEYEDDGGKKYRFETDLNPEAFSHDQAFDLASRLSEIVDEVIAAKSKHEDFNSHHEAASVIREEFEEYWEEVRRKDFDIMAARKELIQTAAMCVRALVELC